MSSVFSHTRLSKIDIFGDLRYINNIRYHGLSVNYYNFDNELEYYYKFCGTCVEALVNKNITGPQKDILLWYWKLGVSMYIIKLFMIEKIYWEPTSNRTILPPISINKLPATSNCYVPDCE